MIEVKQLSKRFGDNLVVDQVSFIVPEGNTLVLLGTSGSGKTTTLKMLNRLVEPTSGSIHINGEAVDALPPTELRRKIGYVIQRIGLFPHYTVAQNVGLIPGLLKWEASRTRARTAELLTQLQLPPAQFLDRYPHELSGGQRQRIGIARALAANPPLILLDEPFGALDPITRQQIVHEFHALPSLRDKTMVMVTHDVAEAVELGDQIALLDQGKIVQMGSPKELLFRPKNEFVRKFFDGNRITLELKTLQIQDLYPYLPAPATATETGAATPDSTPLWEILGTQADPQQGIHLPTPTGTIATYKRSNLWMALENFREANHG